MQQAAVLWAAAALLLPHDTAQDEYWHRAYGDLVRVRPWRRLADTAFAAVTERPPEAPAERAIAIAALGRYALASNNSAQRDTALTLVEKHAGHLHEVAADAWLEAIGLAVYGLVEAGRLLDEPAHAEAAVTLFRERLLPLWDDDEAVFRSPSGATAYTPRTLGALVAALNAMRWHGPPEMATEADEHYPRLFETVLVRAGLLLASPRPLVPDHYLNDAPAAHFAHPDLPAPEALGKAPVFAGEVRLEGDSWRVVDARFHTASALFLANMLVKPRDGETDAFLPSDRLAALER